MKTVLCHHGSHVGMSMVDSYQPRTRPVGERPSDPRRSKTGMTVAHHYGWREVTAHNPQGVIVANEIVIVGKTPVVDTKCQAVATPEGYTRRGVDPCGYYARAVGAYISYQTEMTRVIPYKINMCVFESARVGECRRSESVPVC